MKKLYWVFIALLMTTGLVVSLYYGLKPRPVPKIKFSLFVSPEEMGQATTQRLHLEIQNQEVLVLGIDPQVESHVNLLKGFLQSIKGTPLEYKSLVIEKDLPAKNEIRDSFKINVTPNNEGEMKAGLVEEFDVKNELPRLAQGLSQRPLGHRVLIVMPSIYSTHVLTSNPMDRLKKEFKMNLVSITWADFPISRDEEPDQSPACVTTEDKDHEGSGALGCLIQGQARLNYRKAKKSGKFSGQLDQIGEFEYLGLFTKNPFVEK